METKKMEKSTSETTDTWQEEVEEELKLLLEKRLEEMNLEMQEWISLIRI